ncbi:unnamed protein product [Tuber melanosporum]|uniref:(Perigord truffle) hypothetical protein n=1 Tax=Tuber melanosporum (strain Mel28) TaxID=656061 RepID=D5G8N2_TUBMM|nr:uncharacterized protein GSTUM_00003028001 [Tuber melanosporum]CAZ80875.1 unnamed protein product [Tuber melanosporum]
MPIKALIILLNFHLSGIPSPTQQLYDSCSTRTLGSSLLVINLKPRFQRQALSTTRLDLPLPAIIVIYQLRPRTHRTHRSHRTNSFHLLSEDKARHGPTAPRTAKARTSRHHRHPFYAPRSQSYHLTSILSDHPAYPSTYIPRHKTRANYTHLNNN